KTITEGRGEIQEMIDIADFSVGLSRQLEGLVLASERPWHRMMEQYVPLGPIGIISSFNFPSSVWSWNAFIAAVCGDTSIWKPSSKTPLAAVAITKVLSTVLEAEGAPLIFSLVTGSGEEIGSRMASDRRIKLVSFTGSVNSGKKVSQLVSERLGKSILELGGNNAAVVSEHTDIDIALKGVAFGALATAGQRCTSTRRVIVSNKIYDEFLRRMVKIYKDVAVGDPRRPGVLVGPLIDESAVAKFESAILEAIKQGGKLLAGGTRAKIEG
ncbi:piperideine-6-carboxylate dehydrogenase, partial [mine drainage metagenome]